MTVAMTARSRPRRTTSDASRTEKPASETAASPSRPWRRAVIRRSVIPAPARTPSAGSGGAPFYATRVSETEAVEAARRGAGAPPRCAWCEAALDERAIRLPGRTVCARCGVATTDPWPTDAELDAAYSGFYRPESGRFAGPGDALLRRSRGTLARRIDRIAPPGRILDVGSGEGALLDALQAAGREAVGLERGDADQTGEWAAIVLWHSLEHLREPGKGLDRAASLLAPRGVLLIAIPNAHSLQARLFGERWFALDLPRHLTHIPAGALIERLRDEGLTVERVSHWRGGQLGFGWLHGLAGAVPGTGDLYDAIRRPEARQRVLTPVRRAWTLAAAVVLSPLGLVGAAAEVALRRGGSVYVEARRA